MLSPRNRHEDYYGAEPEDYWDDEDFYEEPDIVEAEGYEALSVFPTEELEGERQRVQAYIENNIKPAIVKARNDLIQHADEATPWWRFRVKAYEDALTEYRKRIIDINYAIQDKEMEA